MVQESELKKFVESNDYEDTTDEVNLTEASDGELSEVADGILSDAENIKQVNLFPDKRKSLNREIKQKIASGLTFDIQDCIDELSDLGYNPEITKKETDQLAALEYVIENKDKIPQLWVKLEEKANEIAKNIGVEIGEKGILNTKADQTQTFTDEQKIAA